MTDRLSRLRGLNLPTAAYAGSAIALGHALGLLIVAEGVETAEQLAALRDMGCEYGQGYFFGVPLHAAAVDAFISANRG